MEDMGDIHAVPGAFLLFSVLIEIVEEDLGLAGVRL